MIPVYTVGVMKTLVGTAVSLGQITQDDGKEIVSLVESATRKTKTIDEELWRTKEACKFLKCSKPTLIDQAKKKGLEIIRIGSTLRFKKSDIMKLGGLQDV